MNGGLRRDVVERHDEIVLVDDASAKFASADLAEDAVVHGPSLDVGRASVLGGIVGLRGLVLELAEEHGHPLLCVGQPGLQLAQQRYAALVPCEAVLEIELTALQRSDDRLEFGESVAERQSPAGVWSVISTPSVRVL